MSSSTSRQRQRAIIHDLVYWCNAASNRLQQPHFQLSWHNTCNDYLCNLWGTQYTYKGPLIHLTKLQIVWICSTATVTNNNDRPESLMKEKHAICAELRHHRPLRYGYCRIPGCWFCEGPVLTKSNISHLINFIWWPPSKFWPQKHMPSIPAGNHKKETMFLGRVLRRDAQSSCY